MPKFCTFSNRIYKNKLGKNNVLEIDNTLAVFNKIKMTSNKLNLNQEHKNHRHNKSNAKKKKLPKFTAYKGVREYFKDEDNLIFAIRRYKKEDLVFNIYEFEVFYLNPQIKKLRNRINKLTFGIHRGKQKSDTLETTKKQVCFGGKQLFKK